MVNVAVENAPEGKRSDPMKKNWVVWLNDRIRNRTLRRYATRVRGRIKYGQGMVRALKDGMGKQRKRLGEDAEEAVNTEVRIIAALYNICNGVHHNQVTLDTAEKGTALIEAEMGKAREATKRKRWVEDNRQRIETAEQILEKEEEEAERQQDLYDEAQLVKKRRKEGRWKSQDEIRKNVGEVFIPEQGYAAAKIQRKIGTVCSVFATWGEEYEKLWTMGKHSDYCDSDGNCEGGDEQGLCWGIIRVNAGMTPQGKGKVERYVCPLLEETTDDERSDDGERSNDRGAAASSSRDIGKRASSSPRAAGCRAIEPSGRGTPLAGSKRKVHEDTVGVAVAHDEGAFQDVAMLGSGLVDPMMATHKVGKPHDVVAGSASSSHDASSSSTCLYRKPHRPAEMAHLERQDADDGAPDRGREIPARGARNEGKKAKPFKPAAQGGTIRFFPNLFRTPNPADEVEREPHEPLIASRASASSSMSKNPCSAHIRVYGKGRYLYSTHDIVYLENGSEPTPTAELAAAAAASKSRRPLIEQGSLEEFRDRVRRNRTAKERQMQKVFYRFVTQQSFSLKKMHESLLMNPGFKKESRPTHSCLECGVG